MNTYCAHPLINAQVERLLGGYITRLLDEGQAQEISVNADSRIRIDDDGRVNPHSAEGRRAGPDNILVQMLARMGFVYPSGRHPWS